MKCQRYSAISLQGTPCVRIFLAKKILLRQSVPNSTILYPNLEWCHASLTDHRTWFARNRKAPIPWKSIIAYHWPIRRASLFSSSSRLYPRRLDFGLRLQQFVMSTLSIQPVCRSWWAKAFAAPVAGNLFFCGSYDVELFCPHAKVGIEKDYA